LSLHGIPEIGLEGLHFLPDGLLYVIQL